MVLLPALAACVIAALSSVAAPSPEPAAASDRWVAPLDGPLVVVRRFDPPSDPWGAGHRGVDVRADAGATVRTAGTGRVTFAAVLAGRGVVVVSHGSLRTTYEPVDAAVAVGAVVVAGQPVGRLEAVGSHCRPASCLHWGLLRGSDYLDPLLLLLRGEVRLLPLSPGRASSAPDGPPPVAPVGVASRRTAPTDRAPPLLTTAGAVTTGAAAAAVLWWRRRGPP
jgi:murein DD-endopeptidase MepM/ murein hydrolase activator NlpD